MSGSMLYIFGAEGRASERSAIMGGRKDETTNKAGSMKLALSRTARTDLL
jgi:hypothetical protein